jgi:probable F420-dependent oxidoreductase
MTRPFRFGVLLSTATSRQDWLDRCRRAERSGFDVIAVPDHLGALAPFAALIAAAAVTERVRLATFMLNSAFHPPALLAREAMTASLLTDGRLELGLGAGYVRAEFEQAGVPWGTAGERVGRLARTLAELNRLDDQRLLPGWPRRPAAPPVLIGGHGDRVLRLAAQHADTVAFSGAVMSADAPPRLVDADALAERVAFFEAAAGERAARIERNILVHSVAVSDDKAAAVRAVLRRAPYLTPDAALEVPTLLIGTAAEMMTALLRRRDRFGISSVFVHESAVPQFAPVVVGLSGM